MADNNLTETMKKIMDGMVLVRTRLIAYKIKMNSELVVMKDGKVVRIKPEDVSLTSDEPL
ncbi:MAG: hypothetical protein KDC04_02425 [Saprospiraceae bacterium]|nr:hypothetical protein [Saprospiraceae bacterium]MCB9308929.1 hypothetical protein [Lewinellaceae bacterium]